MSEYTRHEYGVEVPGRGFYGASNWSVEPMPEVDNPNRGVFHDIKQAQDSANDLRERYRSLGANELADQVRVVRRTVVETRSEFRTVLDASSPESMRMDLNAHLNAHLKAQAHSPRA